MIWEGKEVLHLVLMKDPFQRIMNGSKKIEYRDRTDYWNRRLYGKDIKLIYFQYAYQKETYPKYSYKPDHNRTEHFKGDRYIHAYFDTIIDNDVWMGDGASNKTDRYLSEDYMFCQMVRKMGLSVWFCPWMKVQHVGHYVFSGNMTDLGKLQYAAHGMDNNTRPHLEQRRKKLGKNKSRIKNKTRLKKS